MTANTGSDRPTEWKPGYRPSNGTEGDIFRFNTCDRCIHDHSWHTPPFEADESCPIIMDALAGEHSYPNPLGPPQWEGRWMPEGWQEARCTEFKPCECRGES